MCLSFVSAARTRARRGLFYQGQDHSCLYFKMVLYYQNILLFGKKPTVLRLIVKQLKKMLQCTMSCRVYPYNRCKQILRNDHEYPL